ncbi:hypothetical protein AcW1_007158 [Taiwanofungus camphoratus]|nr:hypothetical protein AcW2_007774 [Antrodia cinnamomea]KAI0927663.1 hypothetical protein AcV5_008140 [Antrodia cinnamomea]KAI0952760.1 hypothetical protein AcW1_007158 [Antrodia cinnamomea]
MATNIEQAISTLFLHNRPLTLTNVLRAYFAIAGFIEPDATDITVPHEALVAFEHAMDKEPALSRTVSPDGAFHKRLYTAEISELRKEYWQSRLGAGSVVRCTCPSCGKTTGYQREELEEEPESQCAPKRTGNGRRKVKRKCFKPRKDATCDNAVRDPNGPSTSALVI